MVTTFPEKESIKNYNEIIIEHQQDWSQHISKTVTNPNTGAFQRIIDAVGILYMFVTQIGEVHEKVLEHPTINQLLNNSSKYDVAFVSPLFNEMGLFFAHEFDASVVLYMATVSSSLLSASMGHFDHPVIAAQAMSVDGPDVFPGFWQRMSFFLQSLFHEQFITLSTWSQTNLWLSHFPNLKVPRLVDLEKNASFGMYFSHVLFDGVRPTMPNTIDVGTIHCRPSKPLPEDLMEIISKSSEALSHGIILVSFGSWLQPEHLPPAISQAIFDTLNELPHLVLLKWSGPAINFGKNIVARPWLPQQDILGHPLTKLFITQGGMMSVQESLYHSVPMLVIPLFGDQLANGARVERQGCGKVIQIEEINTAKIKTLIDELLSEVKYKENVKNFSKLIHDDLNTPLEKAVFWTEYLMRHKGAKHLQSKTKYQSLFHFYNIDLIFATLFMFLLIISFLTFLIWKASTIIIRICVLKF